MAFFLSARETHVRTSSAGVCRTASWRAAAHRDGNTWIECGTRTDGKFGALSVSPENPQADQRLAPMAWLLRSGAHSHCVTGAAHNEIDQAVAAASRRRNPDHVDLYAALSIARARRCNAGACDRSLHHAACAERTSPSAANHAQLTPLFTQSSPVPAIACACRRGGFFCALDSRSVFIHACLRRAMNQIRYANRPASSRTGRHAHARRPVVGNSRGRLLSCPEKLR